VAYLVCSDVDVSFQYCVDMKIRSSLFVTPPFQFLHGQWNHLAMNDGLRHKLTFQRMRGTFATQDPYLEGQWKRDTGSLKPVTR